jgi:hypothetical protein
LNPLSQTRTSLCHLLSNLTQSLSAFQSV